MKTLIINMAFRFAKKYITADRIKEEALKGMNTAAKKAKEKSGSVEVVLGKAAQVCEAMKDGYISKEEADAILGELVTEENINKGLEWIKARILERI